MDISSVNQARVFLWMIVCGAVCTFVFDIFRGIRRYKTSQSSIILIQDLILWVIEICIVYAVAFKLNYAKVRAYEIIALAIGALLYFVLLSDYVIKAVCAVTAKIATITMGAKKIVTKFFLVFYYPVKKLWETTVARFKLKKILGDKLVVESAKKTQKGP